MTRHEDQFGELWWNAVTEAKESLGVSIEGVASRLGIGRQSIYAGRTRPRSIGYDPVEKLIGLAKLSETKAQDLRAAWLRVRAQSGALGAVFECLLDGIDSMSRPKRAAIVDQAIKAYEKSRKKRK